MLRCDIKKSRKYAINYIAGSINVMTVNKNDLVLFVLVTIKSNVDCYPQALIHILANRTMVFYQWPQHCFSFYFSCSYVPFEKYCNTFMFLICTLITLLWILHTFYVSSFCFVWVGLAWFGSGKKEMDFNSRVNHIKSYLSLWNKSNSRCFVYFWFSLE